MSAPNAQLLRAPPRSALQGLVSWSRSASSVSRQCRASVGLLSYLRLVHQVEVARPQVQVAVLPLSLNSKVSMNSKVSSRLQPLRHAVLPHVPWSTRTLVSWQHTLLYDDTLDEPRCTPCSLASRSTSDHELSALPEMVLGLKDFAASQQHCQMHVCSRHHHVVRASIVALFGVPIKCASVAECRPNQTSPPRIIFVRGSFSLQPVTTLTKLHQWFLV